MYLYTCETGYNIVEKTQLKTQLPKTCLFETIEFYAILNIDKNRSN